MVSEGPKFVWSKEITQYLCHLYESKPVLYCTYLPEYKNKSKRYQALTEIRNELMEKREFVLCQNLTVADIKNKLHVLRTQFFKDHNRIKTSKVSGCSTDAVEKPKLWCYSLLEFLVNTAPVRPSATNINDDSSNDVPDEEHVIFEGTVEELESAILPQTPQVSSKRIRTGSSSESRTLTENKSKSQRDEVARLLSVASSRIEHLNSIQHKHDDLDAFGMLITQELRKIGNFQTLRLVKKNIFTMVLDGQDDETS